ncbi:MAG: butyrate kinase [Candidatus Fermentibacter sp.]|nr:butyrate kinase [Candidatus Fermentibacter sp.]
MKDTFRILAINPGSTSTKISVFENEREISAIKLSHSVEELDPFEKIVDQYEFRRDVIVSELRKAGYDVSSFDAVVGRGGVLYPVEGGTYEVNDLMLEHVRKGVQGEHQSNLGALIAESFSREAGCPAYIVDPVVVDEMQPIARFSGLPHLPRRSILHALNQKAVARKACLDSGIDYEKARLIVSHLGGGISAGAHVDGRIIDVNNALNGDGPFSPERSGGLPAGDLINLCFSGRYTHDQIKKLNKGAGGMVAYLGTNDVREVRARMRSGDAEAGIVFEAMAYQVSKEIASLSAVLEGRIDLIVLTGGIAFDEEFTALVRKRVGFLAPVRVYPGEMEMEALALGGLRVLRGQEQPKVYNPKMS